MSCENVKQHMRVRKERQTRTDSLRSGSGQDANKSSNRQQQRRFGRSLARLEDREHIALVCGEDSERLGPADEDKKTLS